MSRPDPDTDLATLVRDAAPRPSAEFLESLDARVAERFDAPERPRRRWLGWPRWQLAGGLAAACTLTVAVAVAVSGGGGGDDNASSSSAELAARPAQTQAHETTTNAAGGDATTAAPTRSPASQSAAPV